MIFPESRRFPPMQLSLALPSLRSQTIVHRRSESPVQGVLCYATHSPLRTLCYDPCYEGLMGQRRIVPPRLHRRHHL